MGKKLLGYFDLHTDAEGAVDDIMDRLDAEGFFDEEEDAVDRLREKED